LKESFFSTLTSSFPSTPILSRFNGSDYSDKELKQWAGKIQDWREKDKTVFVYFNNDAYGFAIKNALNLKKIIPQGRTIP